MNYKKEQILNTQIERILYYSTYVDCFSRIIHEIIENGDENLKPTDLPNLSVLLKTFSKRLKILISKLASDIEFTE